MQERRPHLLLAYSFVEAAAAGEDDDERHHGVAEDSAELIIRLLEEPVAAHMQKVTCCRLVLSSILVISILPLPMLAISAESSQQVYFSHESKRIQVVYILLSELDLKQIKGPRN